MAVEEVFVPVRAVRGVGDLGVEAHDCGEDLGEKEDCEAGEEGRVDLRGTGGGFALWVVVSVDGIFRNTRTWRLTDFRLGVGHCCDDDADSKDSDA